MWRESKSAKEIESVFGVCDMKGIKKPIGSKEKKQQEEEERRLSGQFMNAETAGRNQV